MLFFYNRHFVVAKIFATSSIPIILCNNSLLVIFLFCFIVTIQKRRNVRPLNKLKKINFCTSLKEKRKALFVRSEETELSSLKSSSNSNKKGSKQRILPFQSITISIFIKFNYFYSPFLWQLLLKWVIWRHDSKEQIQVVPAYLVFKRLWASFRVNWYL